MLADEPTVDGSREKGEIAVERGFFSEKKHRGVRLFTGKIVRRAIDQSIL